MAAGNATTKAEAWTLFDRLVELAAAGGYSNPWHRVGDEILFVPDYDTAAKLFAVPILLDAASTTGVRALALDVWIAYELRRAGFDSDRVWPRPETPRILPSTLAALRKEATRPQKQVLDAILRSGRAHGGETGSTANILGKNYVKQVDVVISAWNTGPELMISTKRMDSSFGNNAANRVEESYGDAKNLRSRHPQAALGFVYGLRSTAFSEQPKIAAWIVDLLGKLGREDDAYDAVALLVPEWSGIAVEDGPVPEAEQPLAAAGLDPVPDEGDPPPDSDLSVDVDRRLSDLPTMKFRHDLVPEHLSPGAFLARMVRRVLNNCPINFHTTARERLDNPQSADA